MEACLGNRQWARRKTGWEVGIDAGKCGTGRQAWVGVDVRVIIRIPVRVETWL